MTNNNQIDDTQKSAVECDNHHWVSSSAPGLLISWVVQCSICHKYDVDDMNAQITNLIDSECLNATL